MSHRIQRCPGQPITAPRRDRGFSLIEVLFALLILGVGIVGLLEGMALSLRSRKEAEIVTRAALLAEGKLEELRAAGFVSEGDEEGDFGDELKEFKWREEIQRSSPDGLYEVAISVRHTSREEPVCELRTLLFDAPYLSAVEDEDLAKNKKGNGSRRSALRRRSSLRPEGSP